MNNPIIDDFGSGDYRYFCSRCGRELQIIKVKTKTGEHRIFRCSKCKRVWEDEKPWKDK